MPMFRKRNAVERYIDGEDLNERDYGEILQSAGDDILKTFVHEDLTVDQQVYVARVCSDEVVDCFLEREAICHRAQRVLAVRDCHYARRRLAQKIDLAEDLRETFLMDTDPHVRFCMASRDDLTTQELTELVCDTEPFVVREALQHCEIWSSTSLGDYLLESPDERIRALAQAFVKTPPTEITREFGPIRNGPKLPSLLMLPPRLLRERYEADITDGGLEL